MAKPKTEALHEKAGGLDEQPPAVALRILAEAQVEAARSVLPAIDCIARRCGR